MEFWIILAIIAAVVLYGITVYNKLVKNRQMVGEGWSGVDVQLKRRHDLVPQLVDAVKAYADYEKATMTAVTAMRTQSDLAKHLPEKAAIEDAMEKAL